MRSKRILTSFTGSNPNRIFQVGDENFAVADLAGLGRLQDGIDHRLQILVRANHLDLDLRNKINRVLSTAIDFGVAFLSPEPANLADSHPVDTVVGQGILDVFELEVADNGFDFFHDQSSNLVASNSADPTKCASRASTQYGLMEPTTSWSLTPHGA